MEGTSELASVREALDAGRLTVPDRRDRLPPRDVRRLPARRHPRLGAARRARAPGGAITQVTALCPRCGAEIMQAPEELHLH